MKAPSARRDKLNLMRPVGADNGSPVQAFMDQLFECGVVDRADWDKLEPRTKLELKSHQNMDRFLLRLVDYQLLTPYQAARLQSGQKTGLLLGCYRLLDRLGAGASSVVFKAEHRETRQRVALKVLIPGNQDDQLLMRFDTERRAIAQLEHPNIVRLLDVGETPSDDPDAPLLYYYAMEFVDGNDLEAQVKQRGKLSPEQACKLAYQLASALNCAHGHGLVHRDVKPSNILWAPQGQCKLLDFGLARHHLYRYTKPGTILGALEYIAPEQAQDGAAVDIRADIYGLGSTLYYCLTGQPPFASRGSLHDMIEQRMHAAAPSAQLLNKNVNDRLDALLGRMMELDPADRFQEPREVMSALEEFVGRPSEPAAPRPAPIKPGATEGGRMLYVSAQAEMPESLESALAALHLLCNHLTDVDALHSALTRFDPDLVLLDAELPALPELARLAQTPGRLRKVVFVSNGGAAPASAAGDTLSLPQTPLAVQARLRGLLQILEAERRVTAMPPPEIKDIIPVAPAPAVKKPGLLGRLFGRR